MSNIKGFADRVKSIKTSDIKQEFLQHIIGAESIVDNIALLSGNNIKLDDFFSSWYVNKAIIREANKQGFKTLSLIEIIGYGAATVNRLSKEINSKFLNSNETWDRVTLTVKQAEVLNYSEKIRFFISYSDTLLDIGITFSQDSDKVKDEDLKKYFNKHDYSMIKNGLNEYVDICLELLKGSRAIIKLLEETPDVIIDDIDLDIIEATGGDTSLATKRFGVHVLNPYYWVSSMLANRRLKAIETARKKNEQFAMKISQAINKRNGEEDPELDRIIEVYQNEIIKNEAKIAEIEAKYV